jgi:uncharacterized protein (DUF2235 family)
MPKNIVFCADGTWNGSGDDEDKDGVPDITNVLKLFLILEGDDTWESVRLKDEQEKVFCIDDAPVQVAKYLHGVGDSDNPIRKLLGGVFGAGIIARIVRGYTYISRNYQAGDRIFIVGFSRGAYTARALAGLISSEGLLDPAKFDMADHDLAYSVGVSAWRAYREKAANRSLVQATRETILNAILHLPGFARLPVRPQDSVTAPVECVAVWDTVGSLGVPIFDENGDQLDFFRFADQDLSPNVAHGIHAVSLDEQRVNFQPTLWNARNKVVQYVFPGAHADVGGGYPVKESGLADIALVWMMEQLTARGLYFGKILGNISPNPNCVLHRPWAQGVFANLPFRPRTWETKYGLLEHESVEKRVTGSDYRPENRANLLKI